MKSKFRLALAATLVTALWGTSASAVELVIATVNNGHMIEMEKLSKNFEAANPGITLKWVTLEEGVLRQRVTTDIATKGGQFDVMTIGMYETPIWGKKGWLQELKTFLYMNHLSLLTQMNIITILIFAVICRTFLQHLRFTMLAFFAILVS